MISVFALILLQFPSMLTDFKAQAEALIKFANNRDGLLTCALRSSIVFGPGDTEFVPFLVNLAKSGYAKVWLYFICCYVVVVCIVGLCYNGNLVTILSYCDAMGFYRWMAYSLSFGFPFSEE